MPERHARIEREKKTVTAMIALYCRQQHAAGGMCSACKELQNYAMRRLDECRFQDRKPACAKCPVHCYKPAMREEIRAVMRYSGPRMLSRHPVLAILHLIDARKKPPVISPSRPRD